MQGVPRAWTRSVQLRHSRTVRRTSRVAQTRRCHCRPERWGNNHDGRKTTRCGQMGLSYCAPALHIHIQRWCLPTVPQHSQVVQPYEYGDPFSKKTYLWEFGVPPLEPTNILTEYKPFVSCGTSANKGNPDKAGVSRKGGASKARSKFSAGIAAAMAEQWGGVDG